MMHFMWLWLWSGSTPALFITTIIQPYRHDITHHEYVHNALQMDALSEVLPFCYLDFCITWISIEIWSQETNKALVDAQMEHLSLFHLDCLVTFDKQFMTTSAQPWQRYDSLQQCPNHFVVFEIMKESVADG